MIILLIPRIKPKTLWIILLVFCCWFQAKGQEFIADYKVSKESVLRQIPVSYIEAAKNNLHIMYCGTSHSSQVVDGMRGLMEYKPGDDTLFAVTFNGSPVANALDIHYRPSGVYSAYDLSHDSVDGDGKTDYYYRTIEYLDDSAHADVNVVMWSWCSIDGHDVQIYLDNFAALIDMYRAGGSKGRTTANEVKFVFMTGYASGSQGDTPEPPYIRSPYQNHKRILDFCRSNGYFCLDYWSQDTYEYETDAYNPYEDGNTNLQHLAYTQTHTLGQDWYECRDYNTGAVSLPAHANQHLTGNRRAYGAWWIWARLAGWDGGSTGPPGKPDFNNDGQGDILWRYDGPGGYNTVWLTGTGSGAGITAHTSKIKSLNMDISDVMASSVSDPRDDPQSANLPAVADQNWKIGGTGDFNGDGSVDIVWSNVSDGHNCVWYMDGTTFAGYGRLPDGSTTDWVMAGVGDFNQDGNPDLIWRNEVDGRNGVWYLDGVNLLRIGIMTTGANLDWKLCGTGDFNNDGSVDLVWRNSSDGRNAVWYMDGAELSSVAWLDPVENPDWKLRGTGDFNGDGKIDLVWTNTSNGCNCIWYLDGITLSSVEFLTTVTDTTWKIEN